MNNIIVAQIPKNTMSSREIAEICEKTHANVLRDIRTMFDSLGSSILNHKQYQIVKDERNYTSEILLNKDLTLTLVAGYNALLRYRIIQRWQELEQQQKLPSTYIEALEALLVSEKEKFALQQQAQLNAPKIKHYDLVVERNNLLNATQVAQKLKISATAMNRQLEQLNVYSQLVKRSRVFQQWFINKGFGEMKQTDNGYTQPLFTPKGEAWVIEQLTEKGVIA